MKSYPIFPLSSIRGPLHRRSIVFWFGRWNWLEGNSSCINIRWWYHGCCFVCLCVISLRSWIVSTKWCKKLWLMNKIKQKNTEVYVIRQTDRETIKVCLQKRRKMMRMMTINEQKSLINQTKVLYFERWWQVLGLNVLKWWTLLLHGLCKWLWCLLCLLS